MARTPNTLIKLFGKNNVKLIKQTTTPLRHDLQRVGITYEGCFYEVNGHLLTQNDLTSIFHSDVIACFTGSTLAVYKHSLTKPVVNEIVRVTSAANKALEDRLMLTVKVDSFYVLADALVYNDKQDPAQHIRQAIAKMARAGMTPEQIQTDNVVFVNHMDLDITSLGTWTSRKFIHELSNYNYKEEKTA